MYDTEHVAQIVQIADPAIDRQAIVQQIVANGQARHLTGPVTFPKFGAPLSDVAVSPDDPFTFDIHQVTQTLGDIWVTNDAPTVGLPVLTPLRRAVHNLVVYYVNRLAERQTRFDLAVLRLLSRLMADASLRAEVAQLRQEVACLHNRLAALEAQQDRVPPTDKVL